MLSSYSLYCVQFKEIKIFWGSGTGGRIWVQGTESRITQTPLQKHDLNKVVKQLYWNHTSAICCIFSGNLSQEHLWRAASMFLNLTINVFLVVLTIIVEHIQQYIIYKQQYNNFSLKIHGDSFNWSKNIRELSRMLHNVSFCSFL